MIWCIYIYIYSRYNMSYFFYEDHYDHWTHIAQGHRFQSFWLLQEIQHAASLHDVLTVPAYFGSPSHNIPKLSGWWFQLLWKYISISISIYIYIYIFVSWDDYSILIIPTIYIYIYICGKSSSHVPVTTNLDLLHQLQQAAHLLRILAPTVGVRSEWVEICLVISPGYWKWPQKLWGFEY